MRQLGVLPTQQQAQKLVDYLLTEGIRTRLDDDAGEWTIWVLSEDELDRARETYQHFRDHPDDARYDGLAQSASQLRKERQDRIARAKKNHQNVRFAGAGTRQKLSDRIKQSPMNSGLIAVCFVVALYTGLESRSPKADPLMFVSRKHLADETWDFKKPADAMRDIRNGEVWRLLTPAFVHLGVIHILGNMFWLYLLGSQIELRKGKVKLLLMVLTIAVFSNLFQVFVSRHPFFGGMSGVVYGLFGYVWLKSRLDPWDKFYISKQNVMLALIWFVICFAPGSGVANGGHAGGLLLGALMGYISSQTRRKKN